MPGMYGSGRGIIRGGVNPAVSNPLPQGYTPNPSMMMGQMQQWQQYQRQLQMMHAYRSGINPQTGQANDWNYRMAAAASSHHGRVKRPGAKLRGEPRAVGLPPGAAKHKAKGAAGGAVKPPKPAKKAGAGAIGGAAATMPPGYGAGAIGGAGAMMPMAPPNLGMPAPFRPDPEEQGPQPRGGGQRAGYLPNPSMFGFA